MTTSEHKFFYNPLFQGCVLVLLFIAAYWIPFSSLYETWTTNDDYSYGILIPFISLYFFWDKREYFKGIEIKSNWFIIPLLFLFILLSIYGVLGSSGHISRPVLPVLIVLFAIFCFGWDFFKKFSLPLCFLIFMIPLPTSLDLTVGVFLKSVSSELGGAFLRGLGYSVHVSGNVIDLGVTKLQVVDACSGLRFLFPLMALGVIYAAFFERVTWKRVVCVLATIPIAVFTNVLRIGIAGILTYRYGSVMAEGFFHDFQGLAIFMAAFIFLFIFGRFLRLFPQRKSVYHGKDIIDDATKTGGNKGNITAFITSIVLLIIVGVLTLNTQALPPIKIKGGIEGFPLSIRGWDGRTQEVEAEIIDASGAEEAFSGVYMNQAKENVSLYMGYRSTAFLENVNFFHSPTVCLPSSGWKTLKKTKRMIADVPLFGDLPVVEMQMESMGQINLIYFWFQTKNRVSENKNINRFHLALHAIQKDNTHDLFIRPITAIAKGESIEDARLRMDSFVRAMMGTLLVYLDKNQYEQINKKDDKDL